MCAVAAEFSILLGSLRMKTPATHGAASEPMELTACAKVSRAGALCSGPRIETYGLAEVCNPQTPEASTKIANSVMGKLTMLAAGKNRAAPPAITNREITMVRL